MISLRPPILTDLSEPSAMRSYKNERPKPLALTASSMR
ncbi:hypothetical protein EM6_0157 [Asticcacaulis excentricus]|uniref:Uncharacterized protein n=1 Tax=Asticcacaulis excentricus TaxID=78587 RepID=A0A3G9G5T9_9CAUL|nr:hypothetical protein EM6_0157 [Asticcacaulis excentricus]